MAKKINLGHLLPKQKLSNAFKGYSKDASKESLLKIKKMSLHTFFLQILGEWFTCEA